MRDGVVVSGKPADVRPVPRSRRKPPRWKEVLERLRVVCTEPSAESTRVLREVLALPRGFALRLAPGDAPHAMSPADMMRSCAVQALARWDLETHRAAIRRVRAFTHSDLLLAIVRAHLGE